MMQSATRTLSVLAIAFSCTLPAAAFASEDAARKQLEAARELYATGNWETAKEAYEDAYAKAPEDSISKAEATLEWANLLWEQGSYDPAYTRAKEALDRAQKLKLEEPIGRLLLTLGHIEASRGDLSGAQTTLELCVKLAGEQKDTNFQALCRMNARFVKQLRGKNPGSSAAFKRDLQTLEKSGQPLFVGTALAKSAELRDKVGDPIGALDMLRRAHKQFEKAGSLPAITRNKMRLAQAYQQLGQWNDAAGELDGLVLTFKNMRNRPALVTAYALEARQAEHEGKAKTALQNYNRSVREAKALGSPQIEANAHLALCEFFGRTDKPQRGVAACNRSRTLFERVGMPTLATRALVVQARAAHARNDLPRARDLYFEAIAELEKRRAGRDHAAELATQRVNLCQIERSLDNDGALKLCRDAAADLAKLQKKSPTEEAMERMTLYNVGAEARDAGNLSEAQENLERATEAFVTANQKVEAANALVLLGDVHLRRKRVSKAHASWERGLKLVDNLGDVGIVAASEIRAQLGQSQIDQRQWKDAVDTIEPLLDSAPKLQAWDRAAWATLMLAQAHLKLGDRDAARDALERGRSFAKKAEDADYARLIESNLSKIGGGTN
jgi:tetratricopeptide (TPR) repeat protein